MALGQVIGVSQLMFSNKNGSKYCLGTLITQNFQFVKVKLNLKAVATLFLLTENMCATPMTSLLCTHFETFGNH